MERQFIEAQKYLPFIDDTAGRFGVRPSVLGGIGCRESHWGLLLTPPGPGGTGDHVPRNSRTSHRSGPLPPDGKGFGRGLMQIDFDFHEFARSGRWNNPHANILYCGQVLDDSRRVIRSNTNLTGEALLRATIAAYNCGPSRVLQAIREGRDVDTFTTGGNYSADVLTKAAFFQQKGWF